MVPMVIEQCWWSYPPDMKTGRTEGTICGYCMRYYSARVKPQGVSLAQYKKILGAEEKKLNCHQQAVSVLKEQIISKGLPRNAKFEWELIEERSLKIVKSMEMNIKKPGWTHVPWDFYATSPEYGNGKDLNNNPAGISAGHREFFFEGVRGVLIPDKPITKIEFNEKVAGQIEQTLASSAGD
eukprot:1998627-Pyramimonas_sp.AAC.1